MQWHFTSLLLVPWFSLGTFIYKLAYVVYYSHLFNHVMLNDLTLQKCLQLEKMTAHLKILQSTVVLQVGTRRAQRLCSGTRMKLGCRMSPPGKRNVQSMSKNSKWNSKTWKKLIVDPDHLEFGFSWFISTKHIRLKMHSISSMMKIWLSGRTQSRLWRRRFNITILTSRTRNSMARSGPCFARKSQSCWMAAMNTSNFHLMSLSRWSKMTQNNFFSQLLLTWCFLESCEIIEIMFEL